MQHSLQQRLQSFFDLEKFPLAHAFVVYVGQTALLVIEKVL